MRTVIPVTDIGADPDDMVAMAVLSALAKRGTIRIPYAVAGTARPQAAACLDALFTYYGVDVTVGKMTGPALPCDAFDHYAATVAARRPDKAYLDYMTVLRAALSDEVVLLSLGPLTPIAEYMKAGGSLDNVRALYVMGGRFDADEPEWNIEQDAAAAQYVLERLTCPTVFLPFEIGAPVYTGGSVRNEADNPVRIALQAAFHTDDRNSWDPMTAYIAATDNELVALSAPGRVTVAADGRTTFTAGKGRHRYVTAADSMLGGVIDALIPTK